MFKRNINKNIQLPSEFNSFNEQETLFLLVKRRYADQSKFFYLVNNDVIFAQQRRASQSKWTSFFPQKIISECKNYMRELCLQYDSVKHISLLLCC